MLDYRPDLDPRTPDLLTDVVDMVPSAKGYRTFPTPTAHTAHTITLGANESGITALFASQWLSTPGGIVHAATNKKLYVYHYTNGFLDVSKAGNYNLTGTTYPSGTDAKEAFSFCAFGDVIIATHKSSVPQYRTALDLTATAKFANLGTAGGVNAPLASVCEVASNFVFLGDVATWDVTTGSPDMLVWSAIGNHQDWRINPTSTQCSFAQFTDTPGPITAIKRLGDSIVVFKANSMYLGRYVGSGTNSPIWDFTRISDQIGCVGHRSVVDIDNRLIFVGSSDIYQFDGSRPVSITNGVWETHFRTRTIVPMLGHDKANNFVLVGNVSANQASTLVWSYRWNRWGRLLDTNDQYSTNIFTKTNSDNLTITTQASDGSTTTNSDHTSLYSMYAARTSSTVSRCYNRTSSYGASQSFLTQSFGDDFEVTTFDTVAPQWITAPSTNCGIRMDAKDSFGESWTLSRITYNATAMNARKRFNLLATGGAATNWARFYIAPAAGAVEVVGVTLNPDPRQRKNTGRK